MITFFDRASAVFRHSPGLPPPRPQLLPGSDATRKSGLADLPPELWMMAAKFLPAGDEAAFFSVHPQGSLAMEARAAEVSQALGHIRDAASVAPCLAEARHMTPVPRGRVLAEVVAWTCHRLHRCPCGPEERPFHALLETCMDLADTLPAKLGNRVRAGLLLQLPQPYCDVKDYSLRRHGRFATRLITDLLAAANSGDVLVCRAIARSHYKLLKLITLEHGVGPGVKHERQCAARAVEFMKVLEKPECVFRGDVDSPLATAASLLSCFLEHETAAHLPMIRALVAMPVRSSDSMGIQYLCECLDDVGNPAVRTELMCEIIASMKARGETGGPLKAKDSVNHIAMLLSKKAEALAPEHRAAVNAALRASGYDRAPL